MHILLCDDDEAITKQLSSHLQEFFEKNRLPQPTYAIYSSGEELLTKESGGGDIAFLDVEMAGISGIHVGAELAKRNPNVKVFIVTSYADYLDEAMRFHVFRYLSKPIDKNRLFRNMKDALKQHVEDERLINIETKEGITVLLERDILFVETSGRGTIIHTNSAVHPTTKSMDYWQRELNSSAFFAPHRSFIVNMRYVSFFNATTIILRDTSGQTYSLYMSRRKYSRFRDAYLLYSTARM